MKRASGFLLVAGLAAAFAAGMGAAKLLSSARNQARKQVALANLHCLAAGIEFYRHKHGAYPDGVEVLYAQGMMGSKHESLLLDPPDTGPLPLGESGMPCSYQYVGGVPDGVPQEAIIAYSRKGVHAGERVVLYADRARTVEWASEAQLRSGAQAGSRSLPASHDNVVAAYGDELTAQRGAELREFYEVRD